MASNQDNLKHEVHNLLNSLNSHQETGQRDTGEPGNNVSIITVAGANQGASMRARLDHEMVDDNGVLYGFEDKLCWKLAESRSKLIPSKPKLLHCVLVPHRVERCINSMIYIPNALYV